MYCPKCFNNSLHIAPSGVAILMIDGKKMDSSRLIFHMGDSEKEELIEQIKTKLESYMQWYSSFQNKKPIENIDILTSDFKCENSCLFTAELKFSILNIIIPQQEVIEMAKLIAKKHHLIVNVKTHE